MSDETRVPSTLTLRGTFLGWDKDTYTPKDGGEKVSRPVLVFQSESVRWAQIVRVAADRVEAVRAELADSVGRIVTLDVFAGDYRALVLKSVLDPGVA